MKKFLFLIPFLSFFFVASAHAAVYTQSTNSINYSSQNSVTITANSVFTSSTYWLFLNNTSTNVSGNGSCFNNGAYSWNQIFPSAPFATGTYGIVGAELHGSSTCAAMQFNCSMGASYASCMTSLANAAFNDGIHYTTSTITITPDAAATTTLASTTYFYWGGISFVSTKETVKVNASDTIEFYYDPFKTFWVLLLVLFTFTWGVYKISCMVKDY